MRVLFLVFFLLLSFTSYAEETTYETKIITDATNDYDFYFDFSGGFNWIPEHDADYFSYMGELRLGGMNNSWKYYAGFAGYITNDFVTNGGLFNFIVEPEIIFGFAKYFPVKEKIDFFVGAFSGVGLGGRYTTNIDEAIYNSKFILGGELGFMFYDAKTPGFFGLLSMQYSHSFYDNSADWVDTADKITTKLGFGYRVMEE